MVLPYGPAIIQWCMLLQNGMFAWAPTWLLQMGVPNLAKLQLLLLFQNFVKGCLREFARMYFTIVFERIFELKCLKPEILKGSQCGISRK
jgi:hypothetical protein